MFLYKYIRPNTKHVEFYEAFPKAPALTPWIWGFCRDRLFQRALLAIAISPSSDGYWRRSRVNYYAWRFCTSSCTTAPIYHRSVGRSKWRRGDSSPISLHIYEIACSEEDRWQWCIGLWVRWNNFNKTIRLEHISFYYLCFGIFLSPAVFIPKSVTRRVQILQLACEIVTISSCFVTNIIFSTCFDKFNINKCRVLF